MHAQRSSARAGPTVSALFIAAMLAAPCAEASFVELFDMPAMLHATKPVHDDAVFTYPARTRAQRVVHVDRKWRSDAPSDPVRSELAQSGQALVAAGAGGVSTIGSAGDGGMITLDILRGEPGNGPPVANDPVVTATGEYTTSAVDFHLGGPMPLGFARHHATFASQSASAWGFYQGSKGPMGLNWVHNLQEILLKVNDTKVAIHLERGAVAIFDYIVPGASRGGGSWVMVPPPVGFLYMGVPYQLVENGSKLELMDPRTQYIHSFEFASLADFETTGVESIRDRNGNTHTFVYNPDGTLAEVGDGLERSLTFQYVSSGLAQRISRVTDHAGREVSFGYSGFSLKTATNARGKTTSFDHDTGARISAITRPVGNVVLQNSYHGDSRVFAQVDGTGNTTTFTYDASSATITDALGNTRSHHFDAFGRMTSVDDEAGNTISFAHDAMLRLVGTTDRMGDSGLVTYDAASGYVTSRTDNTGATWSYAYAPAAQEGFTFYDLTEIVYPTGAVATFGYDSRGNVTSFTDAEGNGWAHARNARGQIESTTNPEGGVTSYAYGNDATLTSMSDPSGNVTTYTYDAAKRPVLVTYADGTTRQIAYDANDNATSVTDQAGATTFFFHDDNDNLLGVTDPLGNQTVYAYDGNDDLVAVTDPLGRTTTYAYDPLRRIAAVTRPTGATTSYAYDARRRLTSITDAAGGTRTFTYDDEGVPVSMTDASGETWSFASDGQGRLTTLTNPLGETVEVTYDALGVVVRVTDPAGGNADVEMDGNLDVRRLALAEPGVDAAYLRNGLREIAAASDPRGFDWSSAYDAQGRRTAKRDPLGNEESYGHDERSRLSDVVLAGGLGSVDVTRDDTGRVTRIAYSDGVALDYTYDVRGRLVSGNGLSFGYDATDRMTACNGLAMTYDAGGRLATLTLAPGKTVTYAYDARDLPVAVTDWVGGETTLGYDAEGRLVTVARPNGVTTAITRDASGRVAAITEGGGLASIALARDARGLVTSATRELPLEATPMTALRSLTHDAANQIIDGVHDAMGRCLDDGTRAFIWDLASRAASIDDGVAATTFTYDALGNVLTRTAGGVTRTHVWSYALGLPSIAVVREGVGRGSTDVRYHVHTPAGLLLHTIDAADDTRRFYHYDEMGSTVFLTGDGGAVSDAYAYTPYGELLAATGTTDNPFTYHGRHGVVAEGDLYRMRARLYDPSAGRFVSRDRLEVLDPVGVNPYQALAGNPLAFVDPLGSDHDLPPGDGDVDTPAKDVLEKLFVPAIAIPKSTRRFPSPVEPIIAPFLVSGDGFEFKSYEEIKREQHVRAVLARAAIDERPEPASGRAPSLGHVLPGTYRQAGRDKDLMRKGLPGVEPGIEEVVL